jgi:hypothetical protein
MFGLDMLDVAIGIIVIYLLLSFVASAIAEMLETALKNRSKDLKEGIKELLQQADQENDLVDVFYKHPVVAALYRKEYDPKKPGNLPSYIPSKTFALAFLDIIQDPVKAKAEIDAFAAMSGNDKVTELTKRLTTVATEDIEKKRKLVEDWFDGSMDRVSGWYKRRTHIIMIVIGILMAVTLNVDSIYIVRHLNSDKATRQALVNSATELAKSLPEKGIDPKTQIDKNIEKLGSYGLPVGWDRLRPIKSCWDYVLIGMGWMMTAFAVSLGAPFWFDTLNKVMVIRSTVKPNEKSKPEASEDRQTKPKQ